MKTAIRFLVHVYGDSVTDVARILTAEEDRDKEVILSYLEQVKEFTTKLIDEVHEQGEPNTARSGGEVPNQRT